MNALLICAGGVIAAAVFFLWRRTKAADRLTLLTLPDWSDRYAVTNGAEKVLVARSLLEQSLHLARQLGAVPKDIYIEARRYLRKENPVDLVDSWMRGPYYNVIEAIGQREASNCEARLIGALILVSMSSMDPVGDVRKFVTRMAAR